MLYNKNIELIKSELSLLLFLATHNLIKIQKAVTLGDTFPPDLSMFKMLQFEKNKNVSSF